MTFLSSWDDEEAAVVVASSTVNVFQVSQKKKADLRAVIYVNQHTINCTATLVPYTPSVFEIK